MLTTTTKIHQKRKADKADTIYEVPTSHTLLKGDIQRFPFIFCTISIPYMPFLNKL